MADPKGFLKYGREVAARRPIDERVRDWNEVYPGGPGRALLPIIAEQAGRCMDCGQPWWQNGMPQFMQRPACASSSLLGKSS